MMLPTPLRLAPQVGPRTLVMPAQNGIEAPEFLAPIVGAEHVVRLFSPFFFRFSFSLASGHRDTECKRAICPQKRRAYTYPAHCVSLRPVPTAYRPPHCTFHAFCRFTTPEHHPHPHPHPRPYPRQLGGWCKITSMVKHPGTIRHIGLNPPIQARTQDTAADRENPHPLLGRFAACFALCLLLPAPGRDSVYQNIASHSWFARQRLERCVVSPQLNCLTISYDSRACRARACCRSPANGPRQSSTAHPRPSRCAW